MCQPKQLWYCTLLFLECHDTMQYSVAIRSWTKMVVGNKFELPTAVVQADTCTVCIVHTPDEVHRCPMRSKVLSCFDEWNCDVHSFSFMKIRHLWPDWVLLARSKQPSLALRQTSLWLMHIKSWLHPYSMHAVLQL